MNSNRDALIRKKREELAKKREEDRQRQDPENIEEIRKRQETLINNRRLSREEEQRAQARVNNLYEAIDLGFADAVSRLVNAANVNQVLEETNQTPLQLLARRILNETQRPKIRCYYKILNLLVQAGADASFLSDQDCFVIDQLYSVPLYKGDLPKAKYKFDNLNNEKNKYRMRSKFAKDVFDGLNFHICFLQNIGALHKIGQKNLDNYLYKKEDFTIHLDDGPCGRDRMGVKLGKIYIEYQPGGKGSFEAKVYLINAENKTLNLLHEFDGERYSGLQFEAFIPFFLESFYGAMTGNPPGSSFDFAAAREVYRNSYFLKDSLVQLALNKKTNALVYLVTEEFDNTYRISKGLIFHSNEELETYLQVLDKNVYVFRIMTDNSFIQPNDTEIAPGKALDLTQFEHVEFIKLEPNEKKLEVVQLNFRDTGVGADANSNTTQSAAASVARFSELRKKNEADINRIPDEFFCPISGEVMQDPVTTIPGHTYERKAIEEWIGRCKTNGTPVTNPMSRDDLGQHPLLIPNTHLKDTIDLCEMIRSDEIAIEKELEIYV